MRTVVFILLLMWVAPVRAQFPFEVRVIDARTGQPISNVSLREDGIGRIYYSDSQGFIRFTSAQKTCSVNIRHIAYQPQTAELKSGQLHTVSMAGNQFDLPVATVTETLADTVYGSKDYHVADFVFSGENMFLLTYEKEQRWKKEGQTEQTLYRGCRLVMLDADGRETGNIKVMDDAVGFYDEYPGGVFLKYQKGMYFIRNNANKVSLEHVDDALFKDWIEPVIDSIGPFIFFSNYVSTFPAFEYRILDKRDTTFHHLRGIVDKELMVQFRSEFKWLPTRAKLDAFKLSKQTGIDKEIIAGYMAGFPESHFFESLYAPLFVRNDTVLIFDHAKEKLYTHSVHHVIDSLAISYQNPASGGLKWQKRVLHDELSGVFYALYARGKDTFLAPIDLRTGHAPERIKLVHPYPENIRVRNGTAYFVYRPFGSMQKRFLYKQKL